MTYGDIIEWIEQNYNFEPDEDVTAAFNTISEDWKSDNRNTLEATLGDEKGDVLEGIRNLISRADVEPEDEEVSEELQQRVEDIERGIDEVSKRIGKTGESILTRVVNFFKGLFR